MRHSVPQSIELQVGRGVFGSNETKRDSETHLLRKTESSKVYGFGMRYYFLDEPNQRGLYPQMTSKYNLQRCIDTNMR